MIDQATARQLAISYLDQTFPESAGEWDIADEYTNETADGWLFEWNSAEYIRTRERLLGFGAVPLWVSRTGSEIELRDREPDDS